MANLAFGKKIVILPGFKTLPRTSFIEQQRAQLLENFRIFRDYESSDTLARLKELEKIISSKEFIHKKEKAQNQLKSEQDLARKYEDQKKSRPFKKHLKFKESSRLAEHLSFAGSNEYKSFLELESDVTATGFDANLNKLKKTVEEAHAEQKELEKPAGSKEVRKYLAESGEKKGPSGDTARYLKLKEKLESKEFREKLNETEQKLKEYEARKSNYKKLLKSSSIKRFRKFEKSSRYQEYLRVEKSKEWNDFLKLEEYLTSEDHKTLIDEAGKTLSEIEALEKEYQELLNSDMHKQYLKWLEEKPFAELEAWEIFFEEDFTSAPDSEKWITRYYWGDKVLEKPYAMQDDLAYPTDGKNIEVSNSVARITVKQESVEGLMWKPPFGFLPSKFGYTTGLLSTAGKVMNKFGRIEAKIRLNPDKNVNFYFWLSGIQNLPHIDVMRARGGRSGIETGLIGKGKKGAHKEYRTFSGLNPAADYFIYTLLWEPGKLVWQINGVTVMEQSHHLPDEPLYLALGAFIKSAPKSFGGADMQIDWIRWYRKA
ncbi:MAG: hypothetical protein Kow00127_15790 [Bacteroidales bacterium]